MSGLQSKSANDSESRALGEGIILTIYLVLKPLYLFSSGLPQISDMFLIAAALYMLIRGRGKILVPREYSKWIHTFLIGFSDYGARHMVDANGRKSDAVDRYLLCF